MGAKEGLHIAAEAQQRCASLSADASNALNRCNALLAQYTGENSL
jgi:hypothetical protein